MKCVHHDRLKPSHLKLDSWLAKPEDCVTSEDSVPDEITHSLFSGAHEISHQEDVEDSVSGQTEIVNPNVIFSR